MTWERFALIKHQKGKKIRKDRNNKLGKKEGKKEGKGRMEGGEEGRQAKILLTIKSWDGYSGGIYKLFSLLWCIFNIFLLKVLNIHYIRSFPYLISQLDTIIMWVYLLGGVGR